MTFNYGGRIMKSHQRKALDMSNALATIHKAVFALYLFRPYPEAVPPQPTEAAYDGFVMEYLATIAEGADGLDAKYAAYSWAEENLDHAEFRKCKRYFDRNGKSLPSRSIYKLKMEEAGH